MEKCENITPIKYNLQRLKFDLSSNSGIFEIIFAFILRLPSKKFHRALFLDCCILHYPIYFFQLTQYKFIKTLYCYFATYFHMTFNNMLTITP